MVILNNTYVITSAGDDKWTELDPADYRSERDSWGEEIVSAKLADTVYTIVYDGVEYTFNVSSGDITPLPNPVAFPVVEIMASENGGLPVAGATVVYVKFNKEFGNNETTDWDNGNMVVGTPTPGYESDPYFASWAADFHTLDFERPFAAGDVFEMTAEEGIVVRSGIPTKFYEDGSFDTPVL